MVSFVAPSVPLNVILIATASTAITVSWEAPSMPNGNIRSYRVTVYLLDGEFRTDVQVTSTSAVLHGLQPFTNYSVNVSAITVAEGPSSDPETVLTLQDGMHKYFTM